MHLVMMTTKMADRIFTFLDSVPERKDNQTKDLGVFSQITIKDLTLAYGEKVVLDTIS